VRQSLWDFLDQAQKVQYEDYLWIDALSIDQTNHSELIKPTTLSEIVKSRLWALYFHGQQKRSYGSGLRPGNIVQDMQGMAKMFEE
jgi:hypothetical protein